MPRLPEDVWRRRLVRESELMKQAGFKFTLSNDFTRYVVDLNRPGLSLKNGAIVPRNEHQVEILLGRDFPYAGGLDVHWLTPIFHPNIREEDGKVCIQLLNAWSADVTVANLIQGIIQLLENPNPADPLNKPAADYYVEHPEAFRNGLPPQASLPRRPKIVFES